MRDHVKEHQQINHGLLSGPAEVLAEAASVRPATSRTGSKTTNPTQSETATLMRSANIPKSILWLHQTLN